MNTTEPPAYGTFSNETTKTVSADLLPTLSFVTLIITGVLVIITGVLLYIFRSSVIDIKHFFLPLPPLAVGAYVFIISFLGAHKGEFPSFGTTAIEIASFIIVSVLYLMVCTITLLLSLYVYKILSKV